MSIELSPSRNYPGRTALRHKLNPESNMTTVLDLTPEDVETLRKLLGVELPKVDEPEELTVYGYTVVGRDGKATHGGDDLLTQQEAIDNATEWTKDAKDNGIDWDYRVAAIVDQGGL